MSASSEPTTRKGDAERFRFLASAPCEINVWFSDSRAERVSSVTIDGPGRTITEEVDDWHSIYSRKGRRELLRAVRVAVDVLRKPNALAGQPSVPGAPSTGRTEA